MAENFTTEEIFTAAVEMMHAEYKMLCEAVHSAERDLGAAVADNPNGNHKSELDYVHTRRARRDGAKKLWEIELGFKSGQFVPAKKPDQA